MQRTSLTTKQIAEYCQVTQRTVVQWINDGKLKSFRTLGKHIRVNRGVFVEFLIKNRMPVPEELVMPLNIGSKKKILIVDDDKDVVDSIQRILKREKIYDLEIAFDGFEAGQKFTAFKPDLIILDIKMPGLDGYGLCSHIRKNSENNNVKILLISGNIDQNVIKKIEKSGADDYLAKPFEVQVLRMKLQNLFGWTRRSVDREN